MLTRTSPSKKVIGDIRRIGERFESEHPGTGDISLDVLIHLAIAYNLAQKLDSYSDPERITPYIERAFREMLQVRLYLPKEIIKADKVTRFGRLLDEE